MATRIQPTKTLPVIYISGPMSGYEDNNFPLFNEVARSLRAIGFPTLNPADFGADPKHSWNECLKRDIAILGHAEAVVMLEGWESSKGAGLELDVAMGLGIRIVEWENLPAFVAEFFDRDDLQDFYRDDHLRQTAEFIAIEVDSVELDDDEVEYQKDRQRRASYAAGYGRLLKRLRDLAC